MTLRKTLTLALSALTISALAGTAIAQDRVLNLYSARHYQSDELIFAEFTRTTGIRINQVQADDAGIMARLRAEGAAHTRRRHPARRDMVRLFDPGARDRL